MVYRIQALGSLEDLRTRLEQEYGLRIVNRPGEHTGVWRIPDVNVGARNYYIVVEALDARGSAVAVPILNEEDGQDGAREAVTMTPDLNPRPTSVVPPRYHVSIQIQKTTVATDPWISVVYEGGAGLVLPSVMEATVIRSDGITGQQSASNLPKGTQLLFNGTTRADRVIVNITYIDGSTYTVRDELVPFQNINPTELFLASLEYPVLPVIIMPICVIVYSHVR